MESRSTNSVPAIGTKPVRRPSIMFGRLGKNLASRAMDVQVLAILLQPYDGVSEGEDVEMWSLPIWLQIHCLPDGYCSKELVQKLISKAGKILEMRLNGNPRRDYVRIRVLHDVRGPLTKHVSIIKGKERKVYAVRYEKLARFCKHCGKIGHEFKECGTWVYDKKRGDVW